MTLDERAVGRDNNLNLIRLIAAWAVLASHSYVFATGDMHAEPWQEIIGTTPGGVAVDVFFVVSGFLVTGSLLRSKTLLEFSIARALRIYPGLWVALSWTAGTVGIWFSAESIPAYFGGIQTWKYLLKNAVMITGAEADLPGAFAANILPSVVNGSLWTLRYELRLYAVLALVFFVIALFTSHQDRHLRLKRASLISAIALVVFCVYFSDHGKLPVVSRLVAMFFSGNAYQFFRKKVRLSPVTFILASLALVAGVIHSLSAFSVIYLLCLPYLVLFIAYWPINKNLLSFNKFGDYSYGIYIYACPIQQMIMATKPGLSIWALTLSATPIVGVLAWLSWHFVEEPALARRHDLAARLTPLLGRRSRLS